MKKIIIILCLLCSINVIGATLDNCYKIYSKDADLLFMNTLSALNSDKRFNIFEIQSKNGYILFTYNEKYYILTVTKRYKNQTEIKILPQNSDFTGGEFIPPIVFSMIDKTLRTSPMGLVK